MEGALGRYMYSTPSYSQEGEDLVLCRLFEHRSSGTYVDIGAHHPHRFSNTALLHRKGWRGINVDARPGSMKAFKRARPHDINLEIGVSEESGPLTYYMFRESALNTFDACIARKRERAGWALAGQSEVQCLPLAKILAHSLPKLPATSIDLLSVDVEGLDLQVLRSNDWARYVPRVIVLEIADQGISGCLDAAATRYLGTVGYRPIAKLCQSVFFLHSDASEYGGVEKVGQVATSVSTT